MNPRVTRILIEVAVVIAGFTLLAVLITWPAAANASDVLPTQGIPWDPAGFTWDLWQRMHDGLPLFGTGSTDLVAPFTIQYPAAFNLVQLAFYGPAVAIAAITTPVFAMNVMIISGLAFSGMAMYALTRWLGCGRGASTWAGAALAISPYVLGKAVVHAPLTNVACFPLLILACLWWNERPNWKRALALTGAFALAWTTTAYYGLMALVIVLVICGWRLIAGSWRGEWKRTMASGSALAAMLGLLVLLPIAISVASSNAAGPVRQREEITLFSARLSDYVVPPKDSFLANGIDAHWTGPSGAGGEQAILYLGISTTIIALAGIAVAWWRPGWLGNARAVMAARIAGPLALMLAWCSLGWPYDIAGVPIPVPSRAIWTFAHEFRAFARFGIALLVVLLMVGALVIAAIARRGGPLWRNSIVAAALVGTGADLATSLPVMTTPPVSPGGRGPQASPAWAWLRQSPVPGSVIEYPVGPALAVPEAEQVRRVWSYGQLVHGRRVVDAAGPMGLPINQRNLDLGRQVSRPEVPGAAGDLATAGVRFAVINAWAYAPGESPDPNAPPAGFRLASAPSGGTVIWKVTEPPQPALALFRQPGFGRASTRNATQWHPVVHSPARMTIWAPTRREVRLRFRLQGRTMSLEAVVRGAPRADVRLTGRTLEVGMRTGPAGRDLTLFGGSGSVSVAHPEVIQVP